MYWILRYTEVLGTSAALCYDSGQCYGTGQYDTSVTIMGNVMVLGNTILLMLLSVMIVGNKKQGSENVMILGTYYY